MANGFAVDSNGTNASGGIGVGKEAGDPAESGVACFAMKDVGGGSYVRQ